MTDEKLQKEVKKLKAQYEHIDSILAANTQALNEIKYALKGDTGYGARGFVQRINTLEDNVEKLKNFKNKVVFTTAGASGVIVLLVEIIMRFI